MRRLALGVTVAAALLGLMGLQAAAGEPSAQGLINRLGCLACHAHQGRGGGRAPAWDGVGGRLPAEALQRQITRPKGRMPNYAHLKPGELAALVAYLSGLQ